jgi:hypothetical protein
MSVIDHDADGRVICGWVEGGEVRIARLPGEVLELVSPLAEEEAWLQAFREGGMVMAYIREKGIP